MRITRLLALVPLALAAACREDAELPLDPALTSAPSFDVAGSDDDNDRDGDGRGAVFVLSNAASGNAVLVFPRKSDGTLNAPASYSTGGLGTGGGLGNQGAVVLTGNGRLLYAVNAGSDEISAFRVTGARLRQLGNVPSGGDEPISVAVHRRLLYVLNDGASPNVSGFRISPRGRLTPIPGSARGLSGAGVPNAAQLGFSPDGSRLVVTEKATNQLTTYAVLDDGTLSAPTAQTSAGPTPFGFAFDRRGTLIVSEAFGGAPDASVLSSYRPSGAGWAPVSPLTATMETAACWVVVTPNGRFAFETNTGSNTVSGFRIGHDGSLTLLDADGVAATTGAGPIDMDVTVNGRFLYTLNGAGGSISAFRIGADGGLDPLGDTPGLPAGANGLVAR